MINRIRAFALAAVLAIGLLASGVPAAAGDLSVLSIQSGHSVILNTPGLERVAVGDGRIAGVVPIGTMQVVINGKSGGHTTVFVWTSSGRTTYEITVTEQNLDDLARMLRGTIDEPNVQIVTFNRSLVLKGTVDDQVRFASLTELLSRFDKLLAGYQVVDAVTVAHPLGRLQDEINRLPGARDLRVDTDPKGNVIVSGSVRDTTQAEHVLDGVKGLAGPYLAADGKVVDRLQTDLQSQVDMKVYVLEVDRTAISNLGLQANSLEPNSLSTSGQTTYNLTSTPRLVAVENPNTTNNIGLGSLSRLTFLAPTLNLLLQEGHAKLLSSPDLVTLPNQEATFLVGGEIPIPISNGLGTVSVNYKEFGVRLNVTPTLLGNGAVVSKINPEVSSLDFANAITINGFVIPALKTSRLSTSVVTQSGESIVLGGLVQRITQKNVQKVPVLGDIPILGQLFRDVNYQRQDSDVVFVLTPTILTR